MNSSKRDVFGAGELGLVELAGDNRLPPQVPRMLRIVSD